MGRPRSTNSISGSHATSWVFPSWPLEKWRTPPASPVSTRGRFRPICESIAPAEGRNPSPVSQ